LDKLEKWLAGEKHIEVLYLSYNDIIENPIKKAKTVDDFLNRKLNISKMGAVVEKSLHRNR